MTDYCKFLSHIGFPLLDVIVCVLYFFRRVLYKPCLYHILRHFLLFCVPNIGPVWLSFYGFLESIKLDSRIFFRCVFWFPLFWLCLQGQAWFLTINLIINFVVQVSLLCFLLFTHLIPLILHSILICKFKFILYGVTFYLILNFVDHTFVKLISFLLCIDLVIYFYHIK